MLEIVLNFFFSMILMATLCRSGIQNPSLTVPVAPLPSSLLTVYLAVNWDVKVSVTPLAMNSNTFFWAPASNLRVEFQRPQSALANLVTVDQGTVGAT